MKIYSSSEVEIDQESRIVTLRFEWLRAAEDTFLFWRLRLSSNHRSYMSVPRVYALGSSALTQALAFDIARLSIQPKIPNVVILLQDKRLLDKFTSQNSKIIWRGENETILQFMASCAPPKLATGEISVIDNLVIAEPNDKSLTSSLKKYKQSLKSESNVLIINPGFGLLEFLHKNVWPNRDERPNLFIANFNNGNSLVTAQKFNLSTQSIHLPLNITKAPDSITSYQYDRNSPNEWLKKDSLTSLISQLDSKLAPDSIFHPYFHNFGDFSLIQFESLMINSCVEPLATLLGCVTYGDLLNSKFFLDLIDNLLEEQLNILSISFPFLRNIPYSPLVFDKEKMKGTIRNYILDKESVKPVMLEKARALNKTNINQLNGYFVRLGKYRKLPVEKNEMIFNLIRGKIQVSKNVAFSNTRL